MASQALSASKPSPALAFGQGFPGYDLNEEARSRASERNKQEIQETIYKVPVTAAGEVENPADAMIREAAEAAAKRRAEKAAAAAAAAAKK